MRIIKDILLYFILTTIMSISLSAQTICIPSGNTPIIDGIYNYSEWIDADSVEINISGNKKVTVKYKHDNSNLFFAYLNNLEANNLFPEVLFDINNDKSISWQSEDWWFHVSATDCDSKGVPNNYSNCKVTQTDWTAAPNFTAGPPITNQVEISIPLTKLSQDLSVGDTIGIAFDASNTFNIWNFWPQAATTNNPSTWATAVLCEASTAIKDLSSKYNITIYPNPSSGNLSIQTDSILKTSKIIIVNNIGQVLLNLQHLNNKTIIEKGQLPVGVYMVQLVIDGNILATEKLVITN